jgi:uncharacterized peroxidase-related enzyme
MGNLQNAGKLFNIFRSMANSPAVLDAYLAFSGALAKGKLDAKTREAIALVVGQTNQCGYCLAAHTAIAGSVGMDAGTIKNARQGKSADKKTQAAVTLARALVDRKGNVTDSDIQAARAAGLDDGELGEVVANVSLNLFTNYFNHLNNTEVDFPKVAVEV